MLKNISDRAKEIVSQMTLEEKAGMCSGSDCWHTKDCQRLLVSKAMVSDGPHGLRKQVDAQDNLGIGVSALATCFPTASLSACSFDPDLLYEMGQAIADECILENVDLLLGPGANMKRSPLCGRNFEYFSEDPFLAGKLAAAYIRGVEDKGVGTSLKHFAANNQEKRRMNINAVIDQRTLHEYYLKGFEIAVKEGKPSSVMCSYNKINGSYASENKELLTDVLRDEWGFDGLTISDWGAVHIRKDGILAGLDLEMPGCNGINDRKLLEAVKSGELPEAALDRVVERVVEFCLKAEKRRENKVNINKEELYKNNHELARKVARESIVLLKNEDEILPIDSNNKVAVLGPFAQTPRYQGAGSSKISPIKIDSPLEALAEAGIKVELVDIKNANAIKSTDIVIYYGGLPERSESEGFDREDINIPAEQLEEINKLSELNSNIIIVLMGGSPMSLPFEGKVKGILLSYLGGQAAGSALADIISGKESPSGRLAESWPFSKDDPMSAEYFPGDRENVVYKEGIFNGYRYFDTYNKPLQYIFGYGLSYSTFEYSNIATDKKNIKNGDHFTVDITVTNTGKTDSKHTVLLFASKKNSSVIRPLHQLAGFKKTFFKAGEKKLVSIEVDSRELGIYDIEKKAFFAEAGEYNIHVGSLSDKDALSENISIMVDGEKPGEIYKGEYDSERDFETVLGRKLPSPSQPARRPFTMDNCLADTETVFIGRIILFIITKIVHRMSKVEENQDQMMEAAVKEMPLFALTTSAADVISENQVKGLLDILNGHFFKGVKKLLWNS